MLFSKFRYGMRYKDCLLHFKPMELSLKYNQIYPKSKKHDFIGQDDISNCYINKNSTSPKKRTFDESSDASNSTLEGGISYIRTSLSGGSLVAVAP